jgi:membrane associated rhomboid family serine protease
MSQPARRFLENLPPATRALFLVNVAVFAANAVLIGRLSDPQRGAWFAFSWDAMWEGYGLGLSRIVAYQFTHSFADVMHLLTNLLALWVFGPIAESRLGARGAWKLYLAGGACGALGHLAAAAWMGAPHVSLVGASGACYGLMLYAACVAPHATIVFFIVQMPLWGLAALLVGIGVYAMFVELAVGYSGGVAHSAHLGGAALGYAAWRLGWFVDWGGSLGDGRPWPWQRWAAAWRGRAAARRQAQAAAAAGRLDAILDKVKSAGLSALTPQERRFLEQESERSRKRGV